MPSKRRGCLARLGSADLSWMSTSTSVGWCFLWNLKKRFNLIFWIVMISYSPHFIVRLESNVSTSARPTFLSAGDLLKRIKVWCILSCLWAKMHCWMLRTLLSNIHFRSLRGRPFYLRIMILNDLLGWVSLCSHTTLFIPGNVHIRSYPLFLSNFNTTYRAKKAAYARRRLHVTLYLCQRSRTSQSKGSTWPAPTLYRAEDLPT